MQFTVGEKVIVHAANSREGRVTEVLANNRYKVCFDALQQDCGEYDASELTAAP